MNSIKCQWSPQMFNWSLILLSIQYSIVNYICKSGANKECLARIKELIIDMLTSGMSGLEHERNLLTADDKIYVDFLLRTVISGWALNSMKFRRQDRNVC